MKNVPLIFLAVTFLCVLQIRADYIMPTQAMSRQEIKSLFATLANFLPVGTTRYLGIDESGKNCQVLSFLQFDNNNGSFGLAPGISLGFGYGEASGDNVLFYLVSRSHKFLPDQKSEFISLAIVNRAGFGPDRLGVYDLTIQDGHLVGYKSSFAVSNSQFAEGQSITPIIPKAQCLDLAEKKDLSL
jgi:hypothetical protein